MCSAPSDSAIRFRDVTFAYDKGTPFFQGVSFDIPQHRLVGILGPNGCGKSTLLKLAVAQSRPSNGSVEVCGHDVSALSSRERAQTVSLLPQELPPTHMTCTELTLCGRFAEDAPFHRSAPDEVAQARRAIKAVGLESVADERVDSMSGGQRQRAYLAMMFTQGSDVMLFDEPISSLDVHAAHGVLQLMKDRVACDDASICLSIHDVDLALRYCDVIVLMDFGRIVRIGTPDEIVSSGDLQRVFSVELERHRSEFGVSWSLFPRRRTR